MTVERDYYRRVPSGSENEIVRQNREVIELLPNSLPLSYYAGLRLGMTEDGALTAQDLQDIFDKMANNYGKPGYMYMYGTGVLDMFTGREILNISFKNTSREAAFLGAVMKGLEVGDAFWNKDKNRMEVWEGGKKSSKQRMGIFR